MRQQILELHSTPQLRREYRREWTDQAEFVSYLARRHAVHEVLDSTYPSIPGLSRYLAHDLSLLDIDWRHENASVLPSRFLPSDRPRRVAHYYAFVLAHLVGGGHAIARSASPVLPPWFWDETVYYATGEYGTHRPNRLGQTVLYEIDEEALYWTIEEENTCLDELRRAFVYGTTMISPL